MLPSPSFIDGLGYLAGALTTFAFVPQLVKTWRTRSAEDLSAVMLTVFLIGVCCWAGYGFALRAWPVLASNVVTIALTLVLLVLKFRYAQPR